jgi:hypothetical protein
LATTRILTVNVPRLLGDVMRGIVSGHAGLEIVGDAQVDDMLTAISTLRPDVVVLGSDRGAGSAYISQLTASHPRLRLVSIDAEGRSATVHEPGLEAREFREVSPNMLLELLYAPRN